MLRSIAEASELMRPKFVCLVEMWVAGLTSWCPPWEDLVNILHSLDTIRLTWAFTSWTDQITNLGITKWDLPATECVWRVISLYPRRISFLAAKINMQKPRELTLWSQVQSTCQHPLGRPDLSVPVIKGQRPVVWLSSFSLSLNWLSPSTGGLAYLRVG